MNGDVKSVTPHDIESHARVRGRVCEHEKRWHLCGGGDVVAGALADAQLLERPAAELARAHGRLQHVAEHVQLVADHAVLIQRRNARSEAVRRGTSQ